jgi:RNA-directed DNA polymerase
MELTKIISNQIGLPYIILDDALIKARTYVKLIKIKKRNGDYRYVYQPSKKLKIIQYWLIENIFKYLKVHPAAMAFESGKSTKINALCHKKGRFFLKLDFKDFFPSICFKDLEPIIRNEAKSSINGTPINTNELLEIIKLSCFYKDDKLPIGYPTSPVISNIVMYKFDSLIESALREVTLYGGVTYTRYADDITVSTDKKGACNTIQQLIVKTLQNMPSPCLTLNLTKTHFVSSSGGTAQVTGLRLCHDGHLTIHRKYKNRIRSMLFHFEKGELSPDKIASLKGHLNYIRHVDGAFYTKLQNKYFSLIDKIFNVKNEKNDGVGPS